MSDVKTIVKRLGLTSKAQAVERKANEYLRIANTRLGHRALGQAEVCKSSVCVELASMTLQVPVNTAALISSSGVTKLLYRSARATIQKALGLHKRVSARDLCIRFGCIQLETCVRIELNTFRETFLANLSELDRQNVDFSDPFFLAAVFFLVARKNGIKIAKESIIKTLGISNGEFSAAVNCVSCSLPDLAISCKTNTGKKRKILEVVEEPITEPIKLH